MYLAQQKLLEAHLRAVLRDKFSIELHALAIEQPPETKFGEYALPLAFELARRLKKAPRKIAEEIIAALGSVPGFTGFEVAGAGYINARLDRVAAAKALASGDESESAARHQGHAIVEHTSINPNKAAHVGHLRNAILGDTFVRLLRAAGEQVDVQNYIDNTGVQVADIVVGLQHLENKSVTDIESLLDALESRNERIDYYCWNLYARVSQWYDEDAAQKPRRIELRLATLHDLERGSNETAAVAELISTAILRRHLETMQRLGIEYDFLPRESEILHLHFWDSA
ncbi:MAG: arginine--tRNA ligase, partial [Acidobacteriaceae bacterium]